MADRFRMPTSGSLMVARKMLDEDDPAFLDELLRCHDADALAGFAATFFDDRRSHVRRWLLRYVDECFQAFRHEGLVKRLFKAAEAAGDDEVMGRFLVTLDRSVRRRVRTVRRYDWTLREVVESDRIETPERTMPRDRRDLLAVTSRRRGPGRDELRLFSAATRKYLRRRVWRYFRTIDDDARYREAVAAALMRFTDDDFADGLAMLDSWSAMHAMFHHADVLESTASGWRLADGAALSDLKPAPYRPEVWRAEPSAWVRLIDDAGSHLVRRFALMSLRDAAGDARDTGDARVTGNAGNAGALDVGDLIDAVTRRRWLSHIDDGVAELAAELTLAAGEPDRWTADDWSRVLDGASDVAVDRLIETLHRSMRDWSTDGLLSIGRGVRPGVVGAAADILEGRSVADGGEAGRWMDAVDTECVALRRRWTAVVLERVRASKHFRPIQLLPVLDSLHDDVRAAGIEVLAEDPACGRDVDLWRCLLESPFDDVQLAVAGLMDRMAYDATTWRRMRSSRLDDADVHRLWATVMHQTDRGGRVKRAVIGSLADRVAADPSRIDRWLPLLRHAAGSVRVTEREAALSALVSIATAHPDLASRISSDIDALDFYATAGPSGDADRTHDPGEVPAM